MGIIDYWNSMAIVEHWNEFRELAYSDEVLIGVGALLLLVGISKIIKSSLTMLIWVIFSGLGIASISQGLDKSPMQFASEQKNQIGEYLGAGQELSADALALLCRKLDESEQAIPQQQNEN